MRTVAVLLAAFAALAGPPAVAAADDPGPVPIVAFQQLDARLFVTGWKLARANAPFCAHPVPAIGLQLHDAAAYGDPSAVRRELRLAGDIGVQAVAPGSPAELAGLAANDTLLAIDALDIVGAFPPAKPSWMRGVAINEALEAALAAGPVALTWARPTGAKAGATLTGVPACATRFELLDGSQGPAADGTRVVVGVGFDGFLWPDEELAAALAHELAHNILGHRATFDRIGRKRKLVRLSERDADRLMPWLLRNAGYDPRAAVRFMTRWGKRYDAGLLRQRTHDGWDERVENIEAEIAAMQPYVAAGGGADWARHFKQELSAELAQ